MSESRRIRRAFFAEETMEEETNAESNCFQKAGNSKRETSPTPTHGFALSSFRR